MEKCVTSVTAAKIALNFSKPNCESEKTLEARLVDEIKKRGGVALKLTSQFHRGMPDRLVLLPYHTMAFVEMKSTGEKPSPLQEAAIAQLRGMRFTVRVVDSTETLDELLETLDARLDDQREVDAELRARSRAMRREFKAQQQREKLVNKYGQTR